MSGAGTKTLLILGAGSAIARAYARHRLDEEGEGTLRLILIARDGERLAADATDLTARGAAVETATVDLGDPASVTADALSRFGRIDEALLAYGTLTDQARAQDEPDYLAHQLAVNFTSAALWTERLATVFAAQGAGRAAIVGSVAGDRGRQSNYLYGAAKAGMATQLAGLAHRFADRPDIVFLLVRPGFVDTPMTAHIQPKGALWATPEKVAADIARALAGGRRSLYTPWFWRGIMGIIRSVPGFVFHRTRL